MNQGPLVSIVIPVYNGANYLRHAIDSALAQTYKQVEVIVVNDGSADNGETASVALSYKDKVRYIEKINGGVSTALNTAIREMKGDYFIWLSHDDLLSPERVASDISFISSANIQVSFCRRELINDLGEVFAKMEYPLTESNGLMDVWELLGTMSFCCMTIAKTCFDKVGLFDESNRMTQDVEMCMRLGKFYPFYFNPEPIFYSREHETRGTHANCDQHTRNLIRVSEYLKKNTSFSDFFPGRIPQHPSNYGYWTKLGLVYEFLGDEAQAEIMYANTMAVLKNTSGRIAGFLHLLSNWRIFIRLKKTGRLFKLSVRFLSMVFSGRVHYTAL